MNEVKKEKVQSFIAKNKTTVSVIAGGVTGLVNGVFGGGGGMILVPVLSLLLSYHSKTAHATAILIILPLSIVSGLFYAGFGNLRLDVMIPVGIGVVVGGLLGALLLSKLSSKWIVTIFSLVMMAAGIKMLFF